MSQKNQLPSSAWAKVFFLAALAALYLTLVSEWVSDSLPLMNFDTNSDFQDFRPFRHLITGMSRQIYKKTKKNKKKQKDKKKEKLKN